MSYKSISKIAHMFRKGEWIGDEEHFKYRIFKDAHYVVTLAGRTIALFDTLNSAKKYIRDHKNGKYDFHTSESLEWLYQDCEKSRNLKQSVKTVKRALSNAKRIKIEEKFLTFFILGIDK